MGFVFFTCPYAFLTFYAHRSARTDLPYSSLIVMTFPEHFPKQSPHPQHTLFSMITGPSVSTLKMALAEQTSAARHISHFRHFTKSMKALGILHHHTSLKDSARFQFLKHYSVELRISHLGFPCFVRTIATTSTSRKEPFPNAIFC